MGSARAPDLHVDDVQKDKHLCDSEKLERLTLETGQLGNGILTKATAQAA